MNADSSSSSQDAPALVGRRRLKAAQRLAAGEPVVLAAARVGVPTRVVREALEGDEDFFELVEACREIHHLPREAWFKHLEEQLRDAVDEALAAGRISVVNHLLKATGALDEARSASRGAASRAPTTREVVAGLDREKRLEFDRCGDGSVTAAKLLGEEPGLGVPYPGSREEWRAECDRKLAALRAGAGDGGEVGASAAGAAGAASDDGAAIARTLAKVMNPGRINGDDDEAEGAAAAGGGAPSPGLAEMPAAVSEARQAANDDAAAAEGTSAPPASPDAPRPGPHAPAAADILAPASDLYAVVRRYAVPRPIADAARRLGRALGADPPLFDARAPPS